MALRDPQIIPRTEKLSQQFTTSFIVFGHFFGSLPFAMWPWINSHKHHLFRVEFTIILPAILAHSRYAQQESCWAWSHPA